MNDAPAPKLFTPPVREFMGWPGAILVWALGIGVVGSVLAIVIGAPLAVIPIIGLVAFLFYPFPTLAAYAAVALVAFVGLNAGLRVSTRRPRLSQKLAGALSVAAVIAGGWIAPQALNRAAGLKAPPVQTAPKPVAIPAGGTIALIEQGDPKYAQYARCESLCLSLLLQGEVMAVDIAQTLTPPGPLETAPGHRFTLNARSRDCLKGRRSYRYSGGHDLSEWSVRGFKVAAPVEWQACIDKTPVTIDPTRQLTIIDWDLTESGGEKEQPGYSIALAVVRTVVPSSAGAPVIHEARYRGGWRYGVPFSIWPYGGNAGSGGTFAPRIAIDYFRDPGFPDRLDGGEWWRLLAKSDALATDTMTWLDTVLAPPKEP